MSPSHKSPSGITRRQFLAAGAASLGAAALTPSSLAQAGDGDYDAHGRRRAASIEEAYRLAGFNPRGADAFTVLWMADVHYGIGQPEAILPPIISEVAAMSPRPAFIGIIGDLILTASLSFGTVPNDAQRTKALEEYRQFRRHYAELSKLAPVKLSLGNHDTYPGEDDLGLFRESLGSVPVTHAFEMKGVPFIILNGASCGLIDEPQRRWYREQVKAMHRKDGTLVTAVHQPSAGMVVRERGITVALREGLQDARGDLWVLGGHVHLNRDERFSLPGGASLTQASITAGNPVVWGTERPGYWLWCFQGGRLAGRIFRRVGDAEGWALAPGAGQIPAKPLLLPFEGREDLAWHVMVGEGDKPYLRNPGAAWCLNYWTYARGLEYEFPLALAQGRARRMVALVEPEESKDHPFRISACPGNGDWQEISQLDVNGSVAEFAIPQSCLDAGKLAVKLDRCAVSGFGLV